LGFNGDLYQESGADVVMTTKGDVVRYDSERERLGIGSTNQVLTVVAGLPAWATAGGGVTTATVEALPTAIFTTTSTSFVDITNLSIVKPTIAGGICSTVINCTIDNNALERVIVGLNDNGSIVAVQGFLTVNNGLEVPLSIIDNSVADGNTAKGQTKAGSGTARILYGAGEWEMKITALGVG